MPASAIEYQDDPIAIPGYVPGPEQPSPAFLRVIRGAWFKEMRERVGYQQHDVGVALGVASHRPISSIENGGTSLGQHHFPALAALYEVDAREFGRKLLAVTDPTLYSMIYPGKQETVAGSKLPVIA